MTTAESDYTLNELIYDATQAAQDAVLGTDTVAVVMAWPDGSITTDLFEDKLSVDNLSDATSYANVCRNNDGTRTYIIGADILDGSE